MQDQINSDLRAALIARDSLTTEVLKGLKTAIQYEAVALRLAIEDLSDAQIQNILAREAKKRQDSADIYKNVGETDRAAKELAEKDIIAKYLPAALSEAEVQIIVNEEIAKLGASTPQDMGRVIGAVRARTGASAEGGLIASLVKQSLSGEPS